MKYTYLPTEYRNLQKEYYELEKLCFDKNDSKEYVLEKLEERSKNKRSIAQKTNTIIHEYIETYELDPSLLTSEDSKLLEEFYDSLIEPGTKRELDVTVTFRLSKILKDYYKRINDKHNYVRTLYNCVTSEKVLVFNHSDTYSKSLFSDECREFLNNIKDLSKDDRKLFYETLYWVCLNHNSEDLSKKQPVEYLLEVDEYLMNNYKDDEALKETINSLDVARNSLNEILEHMLWSNRHGLKVDIEHFRPQMERYLNTLKEKLNTSLKNTTSSRLSAESVIYHAQYHLGKITFEELLDKETHLQGDSTEGEGPFVQATRLAKFNYHYLVFLYRFSGYDMDKIIEMSQKRVKETLPKLFNITRIYNNNSFNLYFLFFILGASYTSKFEDFSNMILDTTVYSDKALFVHTEMVKELSLVLFDYMIESNPKFFEGVCGYDLEYISNHKGEMRKLLEECSMFHDVGKFFMLDIVGNSLRNLSDEEFAIIKKHPSNFEEFSRDWLNHDERLTCIHDCALTHHLWHDESRGYPKTKHTKNRPFVDILSIADSLDAATDIYGRPYRNSKTLETLIEEFRAGASTQYGEEVVKALDNIDVQKKLKDLITNGRKEIYYKVYVFNKI